MEEWYWLSSHRMTVGVSVVSGLIHTTAPIVSKFKGQPLKNLINWMSKQGGFKYDKLYNIS